MCVRLLLMVAIAVHAGCGVQCLAADLDRAWEVDGQHPHKFVMELSARYDFRVSGKTQVFSYGAPVGEPAPGPTAFPHRASASENPLAVLGHHQQDSTHISNSVIMESHHLHIFNAYTA